MDRFSEFASGLTSPAEYAFAVAPDDAQDLPQFTRALNVSGAGNIRLETVQGDIATVFVAAGIPFPIRAKRVYATGTDASGIVGLA